MTKVIHIAGAGGVAGVGLTRCLVKDLGYSLQGHDGSPWATLMMEVADETEAASTDSRLADLVIPVPDPLVKKWAGSDIAFLPTAQEVEVCQDKGETARLLGSLAPFVYWVRDTHGAGGKGAQMASEYLPGRNFSCEIVYKHGNIIGHFIKERLAYDLKGSPDPLFQRGSSAVSICIQDKGILKLANAAVWRIANHCQTKPNGVYGVDMKANVDGAVKVTEINAGRFLTASYVYFYSTDYNLPLAMVKAFFNEKYKLGAYPQGIGVIRQTDQLPYVGQLPEYPDAGFSS
jgi:hypothetical protein